MRITYPYGVNSVQEALDKTLPGGFVVIGTDQSPGEPACLVIKEVQVFPGLQWEVRLIYVLDDLELAQQYVRDQPGDFSRYTICEILETRIKS